MALNLGERKKVDYDRAGRVKFLGIDEDSKELLRDFRKHLEGHLASVVDAFYEHVLLVSELRQKMGSDSNITRLKKVQSQHWMNLFSARFDEDYMEQVNQIGHAHVRIGLEPRWYLGGYCFALNKLVNLAVQTYKKEPKRMTDVITAINKAIYLDMDLAISTYIDTIIGEIQENAMSVASASEELSSTSTQMVNSAEEMSRLMISAMKLTESVDENIKTVATAVNHCSSSIQEINSDGQQIGLNFQAVGSSANQVSMNMQTVAAAAEEMSASVQNIASAIEEMSSSLNEVSRNAVQAAKIASKAEQSADTTKVTVDTLGKSAKEIGNVVDVIKGIAAQTNLLALNATIEAASAGDAGKGFAVVANEVKELAKQSAEATEDIRNKIEGMQQNTSSAINAITEIAGIIVEMNQINNTIASAVEEQTATANEISRSVTGTAQAASEVSQNVQQTAEISNEVTKLVQDSSQKLQQVIDNTQTAAFGAKEVSQSAVEASTGASEMARNIEIVNDTVNQTAVGASGVKSASENLSKLATQLERLVQQFSKN